MKEGCCAKISNLSKAVHVHLQEEPILAVCLLGNSIVKQITILFSNYLVLWIASYEKTGYLENDKEAKNIYINIMVISVAVSCVVFPLGGALNDCVDSTKILPIAFICRAVLTVFFSALDKPDSINSYIVCVMIVLASIF